MQNNSRNAKQFLWLDLGNTSTGYFGASTTQRLFCTKTSLAVKEMFTKAPSSVLIIIANQKCSPKCSHHHCHSEMWTKAAKTSSIMSIASSWRKIDKKEKINKIETPCPKFMREKMGIIPKTSPQAKRHKISLISLLSLLSLVPLLSLLSLLSLL